MSTTGSLSAIRRARWIVPVLAVLLVAAIGWWVDRELRASIRAGIVTDLQASVKSTAAAVDALVQRQIRDARAVMAAPDVGSALRAATGRDARGATEGELRASPHLARLREALAPLLADRGFVGFALCDPGGRCLAAAEDGAIGTLVADDALSRALHGGSAVGAGPERTLSVGEPVRGEDGEVVAALLLRVDRERALEPLFTAAREGRSGETYAFDGGGVQLTPSRFLDGSTIIDLDGLPEATGDDARAGVNADGYTGYLGTPVVGAWMWLEDAGFGIAVEMAQDEAYAAISVVRNGSWLLLALIGVLGGATIVSARRNAGLRRRIREAERTMKQLGQYTLVQKIGEGGMGEVYYARHAMMRRPCAIKLLRPDKTDEHFVTRFEREVQHTSRLTHPNTIQIYDYGRTPGGSFYYVMEYLVGVSLDEFVQNEGPLPEGRVIYILRQICWSLNEAHGLGLVHRDIKPANVALCKAGGAFDVVKVLDFGLVIDRETTRQGDVSGAITGTPAYLSPEAITDPSKVDARSDLYALGALGYFLLTGRRIFDTESVIELINRQMKEKPLPPSERIDQPIRPDIEAAIMACLEKNPAKRPKDANALARELEWCLGVSDWNRDKARHWWSEHKDRTEQLYGLSSKAPKTPSQGTLTVAIDLGDRTREET